MRDFRDAKVMARALRDALKAKAVESTHSECLELIAKAFGYENWNILAAKVEAALEGTKIYANALRRRIVPQISVRLATITPPPLRSLRNAKLA